MSVAENHPSPDIPETRERRIVLLLCLLAAVHVFIFSATFPFFNVVDEQVHFDLAVRYSQANLPRSLAPPCAEALLYIAIFGTPEYLWPPATQPGGRIAPPPWTLPIGVIAENLRAKEDIWKEKVKNHEASQPPLYYSIAGAWWRLGKLLKLDGGQLLYWLRFLNIPLIAALAWLGWFAARKIFSENIFVRIAVPAFIAFMPQTTFYAINNDLLSPLTFGAAFVLLLKLCEAEISTKGLAAATGLALAATFLTKISNLPLLAVAGMFLALKIFHVARAGKLRASIPPLGILAACAGLPMAATRISAVWQTAGKSGVREWQMVTVACWCNSRNAMGLPTMSLRPTTTACLPLISMEFRRRISITPAGVQERGAGAFATSCPTLKGWNPSTSFDGWMASRTARLSTCVGKGICTRMPSISSRAFSA